MFSCLPMKHSFPAYEIFVVCLSRKNCLVWPQKRFLKMLFENNVHLPLPLSVQLLRCDLFINHNCSFLQRQMTVRFSTDIFSYGTVLEYKIRPVNIVNHRNIQPAISVQDDISASDFLPDIR